MNSQNDLNEIIIIDDDQIFLNLISRILNAINFITHTFTSTIDTFEYIQKKYELIHLIIIDVFLEDNQFEKILTQLKNNENTMYIPVMAISGKIDSDMNKTMSYVFDNQVEDFIFKPINPSEVTLRVTKLIKLKNSFFSMQDKISGSNKLVNILENKLKDISGIYHNLKKELENQKSFFEAKTELFYSVIHDLKSPLNAITLGTGLIRDKNPNLDATDKEILEEIKGTAFRINKMIMDFLSVIKKDNIDKYSVNLAWMDPSSIIEIVLRESYPEANKKNILLTIEMDEQIELVYWDHSQIFRVITNILDNAIKYSPEKEIISISMTQNHQLTIFTVEDHGVGIPKNELDKIFEMFYQTNSKNPGSGIGLAFCKKIIEKHKGKIEINSVEHVGTKIIVTLPNRPDME